MQNKPENGVRLIITGLLVLVLNQTVNADVFTLFTTPNERQIINNNRYIAEEVTAVSNTVNEEVVVVDEQKMEELTLIYLISGITLAEGGDHTVWIDSVAYRNGDQLDNGSEIKVLGGNDVRVQITTPDGKQYFATSGQSLEIVYLVPASE
ncbi:MAG: hypothetical protein ACI845_002024 [Gammaproteobacteria bacterium]|jgi:hypothetical protein